MTDTPIYDQIRQELRDRPDPVIPRSRTRYQAESRDPSPSTGISVWALIDEHRAQRGTDTPGRRRA
ncbi:hypothetical protein [Actinokineospora sp.]|uniref:hypothetical protein n=1 Tax=Actinokineospora sp. TaxID=1872133 RepID=UPI0040379598